MYDEEDKVPQVTRDDGPLTLPADVLLIVPVRNIVMFPGAVTQVALTRDFSMRAAQEAVQHGYKLGIVLQKDPSVDAPEPDDLYRIGTTVTVVRELSIPFAGTNALEAATLREDAGHHVGRAGMAGAGASFRPFHLHPRLLQPYMGQP